MRVKSMRLKKRIQPAQSAFDSRPPQGRKGLGFASEHFPDALTHPGQAAAIAVVYPALTGDACAHARRLQALAITSQDGLANVGGFDVQTFGEVYAGCEPDEIIGVEKMVCRPDGVRVATTSVAEEDAVSVAAFSRNVLVSS